MALHHRIFGGRSGYLVRVSWGGRVGSRAQVLSWGVVLTSSWAEGGLTSSWWGFRADAILGSGWPDAMG